MSTQPEIVEGEVRAPEPLQRALAVSQPGQVLVARATDQADAMIAHASRLATALKQIVDKQRLFATIKGKKYPQVEAWMTIGRMDNVVAREAEPPIRHDDGSYEAFAELVRLSDGMVIGRASALCGTKDDAPWHGRAEPARRSMAVTRATSRALRLQYSWIMALAGYEPTPVEEMPVEERDQEAEPHRPAVTHSVAEGQTDGPWSEGPAILAGRVTPGKPPVDLNLRAEARLEWEADGEHYPMVGFVLTGPDRAKTQVLATRELATALAAANLTALVGVEVRVEGELWRIPWENADHRSMPPYRRLILERIETPEFILPAPVEAPSVEAWSAEDLAEAGVE